ncbi:MAG: AsmA family protein [Pseudomonadota bacterium]
MQLEGKAKRIGLGVAVPAALIALGVTLFDWNMLRGFVSHQVSERTGRSFAIRGDLDVKLSMTPTIRMHDIVMGNAPWGSRPDMRTSVCWSSASTFGNC